MVFRYLAHKSSDLSILVDSKQWIPNYFSPAPRPSSGWWGWGYPLLRAQPTFAFQLIAFPGKDSTIKTILTWQCHPGWLLHRRDSCWMSWDFPSFVQPSSDLPQVMSMSRQLYWWQKLQKVIVWQKKVIVWQKKSDYVTEKSDCVTDASFKKRDIPVFHFCPMMIVTFIILS